MDEDPPARPLTRRAFLGASAAGASTLLAGCATLADEQPRDPPGDDAPVRIAHYDARNSGAMERALGSLQRQFDDHQERRGRSHHHLAYESGNAPVDVVDYDDRDETIAAIEDQLHDAGLLDAYDVHVIEYAEANVFDGSEMLGAGFSVWQAGEPTSKPAYAADVADGRTRQYPGRYAFAFVNRFTGLFDVPTSTQVYRNTVVHEVGHCFHCQHEHGTIFRRNPPFDADLASPMASWYAGSTPSVFNNGWDPTRFHDVEEGRSAGAMTSRLSPAALEQLDEWIHAHEDWFGERTR